MSVLALNTEAPHGEARTPLPNPAIAVEGLRLRARGRAGGTLEILSNIDLAVRDGEFVSIVGPSGCGKSTLLNIAAGLLPAHDGRVTVFGERPGEAAGVGYLFQQHGLLPWRSLLKNVELGLEIAGVNKAERTRRASAMLADVGLAGFEVHFPSEVSGGMRQRAALARTLVAAPRLVLMDEPFGALDAQTRTFIHELFCGLWEAHRKTVLLVTHDLEEAVALSDRVLVMSARPGQIIAEYRVTMPRPRRVASLRGTAEFNRLTEAIWNDLRDQATLAMRRGS